MIFVAEIVDKISVQGPSNFGEGTKMTGLVKYTYRHKGTHLD